MQILRPGSGLNYTGISSSSAVILTATPTPSVTMLPIQKGDAIGLKILMGSTSIAMNATAAQAWFGGVAPLADGASGLFTSGGTWETLVQATIQPAPVASLTSTPKQKLKKASVTVSSTESGNVAITAKVKGVKGSVAQSEVLGGGKSAFVNLDFRGKLKRKIKKAIRKKGKRKVNVTAVVTDPLGQTSTATTGFKVK